MASDWTTTIDVTVTEGCINYIATVADPNAHGAAEILGDASFFRMFPVGEEREPLRETFPISLVIEGRSISQKKREGMVWPKRLKEITDYAAVYRHSIQGGRKRISVLQRISYLDPDQFDKLLRTMPTGTNIRVYSSRWRRI
jgi:hypothetical protein